MINRVILVGRITKDPEIRYLQNGTATVSFTIACDRQYVAQNDVLTEMVIRPQILLTVLLGDKRPNSFLDTLKRVI